MATHVIRVRPDQVALLIQAKKGAVLAAVRGAALESANATLPRVVRDSPVDQGIYRNSWEVEPGDGEKNLARLINPSPVAGIIELGARPFTPPLAPLIEWVKRKFGDLGLAGAKGRKRFRGPASLTAEQEQQAIAVARAIQRAIARRGLPPRRVMGRNLPYARDEYRRAYERRLRELAAKP